VTKHILRISSAVLFFLTLTVATTRSLAQITPSTPALHASDPTGGDPEPIDPGGSALGALHLSWI
jgi:hypothetical protein